MLGFKDFIDVTEKTGKANEDRSCGNQVAKAKDMVYMALFELQNIKTADQ